jgi:Ala-tRNA(Pro) deacylase
MAIAPRVVDHLARQGIAYETVAHPKTYSSAETASAAHIDDDHIAKAVILKDAAGYLMAIIPGRRWLDLHRTGDALGRTLELASEEEADALFPDCESGAFPPLATAYQLESVLDEDLTSLFRVYFEAGDHRLLIAVEREQFLTLMKGVRLGHFSETA